MRKLGRGVVWLLDSVMLFAFPTAKQTWENRVLVGIAVVAEIHHAQ